ncbi:MAG: hypothetical protein JWO39_1131 [Gemmatimonadetes bacterium]|nr:hypothetical protein [Gemmatimonadota bacterium]
MKVAVDLDELVAAGQLSPADAANLRGHSTRDTVSGGVSTIVTFGVLAIVASVVVLLNSARWSLLTGMALAAVAVAAEQLEQNGWRTLRQSLLIIGALLAASGFLILSHGTSVSWIMTAAALLALSLVASSGFVAVLAAIAAGPALNSSMGYSHAMYAVMVQRPMLSIAIYGVMAFLGYQASVRLPQLAKPFISFSRASLFLAQFGFWVGSLWGDPAGFESTADMSRVSPSFFALAWAVTLAAVGVWAARANRRWVANLCAVFGMIDFYTQWFERLSASPTSVLVAGVITLGVGIALARYNRR